jgi:ketosteroid isomerase-like protein
MLDPDTSFRRPARLALWTAALFLVGCAGGPAPDAPPPVAASAAPAAAPLQGPVVPLVDYHVHINSLMYAQTNFPPILPTVEVPADIGRLLDQLGANWNSKAGLAPLFTEDSIMIRPDVRNWIRGRDPVAEQWSRMYTSAFSLTPVAYRGEGSTAYVAAYVTRGDAPALRHSGAVLLTLRKERDGAWRVAAKTLGGGQPRLQEPVTAEQMIAELDAAGIRRAHILSAAFVFGSALGTAPDERARVREENEWNAVQAARYPDRLIAFCSFNPLRPYALEEVEACAANPAIAGLKFHFSDSG